MKRPIFGFTLIEVMIVTVIVSLLTAVTVVSFSSSNAEGRDFQRKADLRALQSAVELYKQEKGFYPAGCNVANNWSGQLGSGVACSSGSGQYIVDLAPQYIPTLPTDPKLNSNVAISGYMYVTNSDRSSYKIMAKNTVEKDTMTDKHPFKSCDWKSGESAVSCDPSVTEQLCDVSLCNRVYRTTGGNTYNNQEGTVPNACKSDGGTTQFRTSYAVWGGYAIPISTLAPNTENYTANQERLTEAIWCKI